MDFDDVERMMRQKKAERFGKFQEAFNKAQKEGGDPRTLDDFVKPASQPEAEVPDLAFLKEVFLEIRKETTDESFQDITTRSLGLYRSIIRHVRAGGTVKFVAADGAEKTLKVRLR